MFVEICNRNILSRFCAVVLAGLLHFMGLIDYTVSFDNCVIGEIAITFTIQYNAIRG